MSMFEKGELSEILKHIRKMQSNGGKILIEVNEYIESPARTGNFGMIPPGMRAPDFQNEEIPNPEPVKYDNPRRMVIPHHWVEKIEEENEKAVLYTVNGVYKTDQNFNLFITEHDYIDND